MAGIQGASRDTDETGRRRTGDLLLSSRIARLAWFELADAATRRALAMQLLNESAEARH